MRINVYREELTRRVEKISKTVDGITYYGLRIYLYMPVTAHTATPRVHSRVDDNQIKGPFLHREGDDDSSAITFWGDGADLCNLVNDICEANLK